MKTVIPGLELSRRFYFDVVKPILLADFANLCYLAAHLGKGSEVLGYDTPLSTDHDWRPRLQLFLSTSDYEQSHQAVTDRLRFRLPSLFLGYPTNFGEANLEGTRLLVETGGPISHRAEIWTATDFFVDFMAFDPRQEHSTYDWLTWPQQHLLGVTAGEVFEDSLAELIPLQRKLQQYPPDVWLYLLAAQWALIGQEEHFVGRTGCQHRHWQHRPV